MSGNERFNYEDKSHYHDQSYSYPTVDDGSHNQYYYADEGHDIHGDHTGVGHYDES